MTGPAALKPIASGTIMITRPAAIPRQQRPNSVGCCSAYLRRALPASVNWSRVNLKVLVSVIVDESVEVWLPLLLEEGGDLVGAKGIKATTLGVVACGLWIMDDSNYVIA